MSRCLKLEWYSQERHKKVIYKLNNVCHFTLGATEDKCNNSKPCKIATRSCQQPRSVCILLRSPKHSLGSKNSSDIQSLHSQKY